MTDEATWKAAQSVVYKGYQIKDGSDSTTFDIRLVAGLNELTYANTGFLVYAIEEGATPKSLDKNTTSVYTALNAYSANGSITVTPVTAESQNCQYLSAISISGIPTTGALTLVVKPYVTLADGDTTETVYGSGAVIVIENGVITSHTAY